MFILAIIFISLVIIGRGNIFRGVRRISVSLFSQMKSSIWSQPKASWGFFTAVISLVLFLVLLALIVNSVPITREALISSAGAVVALLFFIRLFSKGN